MASTRRIFVQTAAAGLAALCVRRPLAAQTQADEVSPDEHRAMREKAEAYRGEFRIPGLTVAIARGGRLVYSQGFGIAAEGVAIQPTHLLRIASVSKPITAVAIFSLIEQGRLRLTDRVFGPGGVLAPDYSRVRRISPIDDITIAHLLEHTAGGWRNDNQDPMFKNPGMNHRELIGWTLENVPLTNSPGTKHAYSNFGYCVLGRVIEKVTGQSYEAYVRSALLSRCGITTMKVSGNTRSERAAGEVSYFQDGNPYNMNVRRMDLHGGWIASSVDLVRFATYVDGFSEQRTLLRLDTIKTMVRPSAVNAGYAYGWAVNSRNNYWHNGNLPGTSAILVRTQSGSCWAGLANARQGKSAGALDNLIWDMARTVRRWQP